MKLVAAGEAVPSGAEAAYVAAKMQTRREYLNVVLAIN